MRTSTRELIPVAIISIMLAATCHSQDTNAPRTSLEAFEAQTGTVIIKGVAQIGSVSASAGVVSVSYKESMDATTGRKEHGIEITLKEGNGQVDTTVIDYDELDSLIKGIQYISRVSYSVTSLPGFDAVYTTKGGLRIAVFSSNRRPGNIQGVIQGSHFANCRLFLASDQLAQLHTLVLQAKGKLDALRANR